MDESIDEVFVSLADYPKGSPWRPLHDRRFIMGHAEMGTVGMSELKVGEAGAGGGVLG